MIPLFDDFEPLALLLVEPLVGELAVAAAVVHLVALAVEGQFREVLAVAAFSKNSYGKTSIVFGYSTLFLILANVQLWFLR